MRNIVRVSILLTSLSYVTACSGPSALSVLSPPSLDTPTDAPIADSEVSEKGEKLDAYLGNFDVTTRWLFANGAAPLVNWQTGLATGNNPSSNDCLAQEGAADTWCSSFVSAVTWWGSYGDIDLFPPNSLEFLRPFNGPGTDITLPQGVTYPQSGCAWRDYLSNYQQDWLAGTLQVGQGLPYASDSNHTWDYWTRNPQNGDPAAPGNNSAWVSVLDGHALRLQNDQVADVAAGTDGLALGEQALVVAQRLANQGHLVIAGFRATTPRTPGHVAVLRVSTKALADLLDDGPDVISAGAVNSQRTSVRAAFDAHSCDGGIHPVACGTTNIGAWESMATDNPTILFYFHAL